MTVPEDKSLGTAGVLWNLADLYAGLDDAAIKADIRRCEEEAQALNRQYEGRIASLDAQEILKLVSRLEELEALFGRVSTFGVLLFAVNTRDQQISAFYQQIREAASRISRETIFFELEWNKLPAGRAEALLASAVLAHYRHYLANIRRYAPHQLSQVEEKLLLERAPIGRGSWTSLFEKVMGHLQFGDRGRTEEEVLADLYHENRQVRQEAAAELTAGLKSQSHVLTHIFNTLLADKMISDRLRRYDSWINSMNLGNELENNTVDVLIAAVTGRYDIPQRYYRVKRRLLGLEELFDYDRYAPLPHLPTARIAWDVCRETVLAAFAEFAEEMADIAAMFFAKQWIDAPVREGKRGGAFAHPCVPGVHPYIMVNYTGNLRDVSTVAHELGHGIHQYLAAARGYYNSSTPLVLAETASVFAELLVFNFQLKMLARPEERQAFICQKLESIFATVFRQVAMNRFEDQVHNARRQQGEISTDMLAQTWLTTQQAMFDNAVTLTEDYGNWWSYIPHFLSTPGYVYSYAFGELLVLSLYGLYKKQGNDFVPRYLDLLKAGGSLSPYDLLKPFDAQLDNQDFWQGGLSIIDEMLMQVE
jgi:oligoendopeptidase F